MKIEKNYNIQLDRSRTIHQEVFKMIEDLGIEKAYKYYLHLVANSHFKTNGERNKAIKRVEYCKILIELK